MAQIKMMNGTFLAVAGFATLVAMLPTTAQAGFEWTPPPARALAVQNDGDGPSMPALPQGKVEMIDLDSTGPLSPLPPAVIPAAPAQQVISRAPILPDEPAPALRRQKPALSDMPTALSPAVTAPVDDAPNSIIAAPAPVFPTEPPVDLQIPRPPAIEPVAAAPVPAPLQTPRVERVSVSERTYIPARISKAEAEPTPAPLRRSGVSPAVKDVPVNTPPVNTPPVHETFIRREQPAHKAAMDRGDVKRPALENISRVAAGGPSPVVTPRAATTAPDTQPVLDGFGSDIPLLLALPQIVPPQYAYSFDGAVDQGARISWNGGQSWDVVLAAALKPLSLGVMVQDNKVLIAPQARLATALTAIRPAAPQQPQARGIEARASAPVLTSGSLTTGGEERYIRREPRDEKSSGESSWSWLSLSSIGSALGLSDEEETATPAPRRVSLTDDVPQPPVQKTPAPQTAAPISARPEAAPVRDAASVKAPQKISSAAPQSLGMENPFTNTYWQAQKGDSLKTVLQNWSKDAGVKLYWVAPQDFTIPAGVRIDGDFQKAVGQVLGSYSKTGTRPVGKMHPNMPDGSSVLIIDAAG